MYVLKDDEVKYQILAEKKRPGCGRSMAVFLAGAHCAVSNPLDYSAFVGSIGNSFVLFGLRHHF